MKLAGQVGGDGEGAYCPPTSCTAPVSPHPISSQPTGCRGRRVAITSPRVTNTVGWMVDSRQ